MKILLTRPCSVPSRRSVGLGASRSLPNFWRIALAVWLLAGAGGMFAQTAGVTAIFTGTLGDSAATTTGQSQPKATQASPSQPAIVFSSVSLGTSAPPQLTATFAVSGYSGSFTPTAVAHYGIDYTAGAVSCTGGSPTETCTIPITFTPTLPGSRKDALFLMNGTTRLATVLINGIGQAPMALNQPGALSVLYTSPSTYFYNSTVDENGTVYVIESGSIVAITKAGVATTLTTGSNHAVGVAIDGAGVLYIADGVVTSGLVTYDTVQGISGTLPIASSSGYFPAVAVGGAGNVYALDFSHLIDKVKPDGSLVQTPISPSFGQPTQLAVDSDEDVFFGNTQIDELTTGGTQTNINSTGSATDGLAVDAAKTLYATRYTNVNGVAELAAIDYNASQASLDSGSPLGLSLGSDGTLYVGNYNNLDKVDRGQGKLDFGQVFPGNAFQNATASIYNGGNQPLLFSNVSLTGDGYQFVTLSGTNCVTGTSVPPGAICSIGISFAPTHPGIYSGSLTVTTNSLNRTASAQTTALTGTVYGPYLAPSVNPVTFADSVINASNGPLTVTLVNQGSSFAGTLTNATSSDPAFVLDRTGCTTAIPVGSTCPLAITFTPTAINAYTATITLTYVSSNGGTALTSTFTVRGNGIAPPTPQAVLTPSTIAFPNQIVSTTSSFQTITVSNPGNASLSITGISLTGSGAANFAETTTCGASLAAGASCTIPVTFTPSGTASYSAAVSITDNAAGSPQSVTLSGVGIPAPTPVVSLTPASLTFPNTVVGVTSAAQSITLSNTGNATLNIAGISITGTNPTSFTAGGTCGPTLAAGSSCSIAVTFTPTAATALSASVTVTDNAAGSPHATTLAGTATAADFALSVSAPTQTLSSSGGTVQYTIAAAANSGSYSSPITFSISALPSGATASFAPPTVTPGTGQAATTLTITATHLNAFLAPSDRVPGRRRNTDPALLPVALVGVLCWFARRRKLPEMLRITRLFLLVAAILAFGSLTGCGNSPSTVVRPGTYTLTVTGTSSGGQHSTSITLVVN